MLQNLNYMYLYFNKVMGVGGGHGPHTAVLCITMIIQFSSFCILTTWATPFISAMKIQKTFTHAFAYIFKLWINYCITTNFFIIFFVHRFFYRFVLLANCFRNSLFHKNVIVFVSCTAQ